MSHFHQLETTNRKMLNCFKSKYILCMMHRLSKISSLVKKHFFNILSLQDFNLFPFQLFSHTCTRHLKVSLRRLHKLMFAWWRRRIRASQYPNRVDALSFSSATLLFPHLPSLTRFSQHLTTESEMLKEAGRMREREECNPLHKANTVPGFFSISEGMWEVPCCGCCLFFKDELLFPLNNTDLVSNVLFIKTKKKKAKTDRKVEDTKLNTLCF